jgi:glycine/D-amino acid oxidase-like deaminating enzyme
MMSTYTYPTYPFVVSDAQRQGRVDRHPVVIVGAGPIGLTAALDCAQRGLRVLLLDDNDTVSIGSRAVCYAKRPLEVWDRLGVAAPMVAKGVSWQVGKVFFRDELAYQFDLLPEADHQMPAMINLQQYHLEEMLIAEAIAREPRITLAWKHRLLSLQQHADHALLSVETPDGHLPAAGRLGDRLRRGQQRHAAHGGRRLQRPVLPGPLPDRRRGDEDHRLPHRALVLVRPAVPPRPERAAAQAGRQRLAHRLPARLERRPR